MTALHDWLTAAQHRPYDDVGSLARVYLERLPRCGTPAQLRRAVDDAQEAILAAIPPYTMAGGRSPEQARASNAAITRAERESAWRDTVLPAVNEAVRLWREGADPVPPVPSWDDLALVGSRWTTCPEAATRGGSRSRHARRYWLTASWPMPSTPHLTRTCAGAGGPPGRLSRPICCGTACSAGRRGHGACTPAPRSNGCWP